MVIDIINYTEEQFAALSTAKLQKIRDAQTKKNNLTKAYNRELTAIKQRLINRGVFSSTIYEKKKSELTAEYEGEVEDLREALLFYLRYTGSGGAQTTTPADVPYTVDYSLTETERMTIVRSYYEQTYSDAQERFSVFSADTFARTYLGEMYAPLYHYFENLI